MGELHHVAQPSINPNDWVMTQQAFEALLRWLHPDRDLAGQAYEKARVRLMKYFEAQGCPLFAEYTDEVFHRAARKLAEETEIQVNEPIVYLYGIARNILREHWRNQEKAPSAIDSLPVSAHPLSTPDEVDRQINDRIQNEHALDCLEECLDGLPAENRDLFIEYHQGKERERIENRTRLASRLGIPLNALRIRAHRIREKLEKCVEDCIEQKNKSVK